MSQYYDNVVGRHSVGVQFYSETRAGYIPCATLHCDSLLREALDNLGRDVEEEDGGNEGQ